MSSKRFNLAIKILVSLGLLVFLATQLDISIVLEQVKLISPGFIILMLIYYTVCQWISCLRWRVVIRSFGHIVTASYLLSSYFGGMFLNTFLPGSFGGDIYRAYRINRKIDNPEISFVTVFLERFIGLLALSMLAVAGLPVLSQWGSHWDIVVIFLFCSGSLVCGVLLLANRFLLRKLSPWLVQLRLKGLIDRLVNVQILLHQFAGRPKYFTQAMGFSLLFMLAIVDYHYWIAHQLHIPISRLQLLIFIPITAVISLLPISLGGLGLKEGVWVYLFTRSGIPAESALIMSLTIVLFSWLLSLPGGLIVLGDSLGWQLWQRQQQPIKSTKLSVASYPPKDIKKS